MLVALHVFIAEMTVCSSQILMVGVGCGDGHSCALTATGTLWCWGSNTYGQLGQGLNLASGIGLDCGVGVPLEVSVLPVGSNVTALAVGYYSTCATLNGTEVLCWGVNSTTVYSYSATAVSVALPVGVGVAALSAGYGHTCALLSTGVLWCWGWNYYGQLGLGYANTTGSGCDCVTTPHPVSLAATAIAVSTGYDHTCVVLSTGALQCWGGNRYGQLGNGGTIQ